VRERTFHRLCLIVSCVLHTTFQELSIIKLLNDWRTAASGAYDKNYRSTGVIDYFSASARLQYVSRINGSRNICTSRKSFRVTTRAKAAKRSTDRLICVKTVDRYIAHIDRSRVTLTLAWILILSKNVHSARSDSTQLVELSRAGLGANNRA